MTPHVRPPNTCVLHSKRGLDGEKKFDSKKTPVYKPFSYGYLNQEERKIKDRSTLSYTNKEEGFWDVRSFLRLSPTTLVQDTATKTLVVGEAQKCRSITVTVSVESFVVTTIVE